MEFVKDFMSITIVYIMYLITAQYVYCLILSNSKGISIHALLGTTLMSASRSDLGFHHHVMFDIIINLHVLKVP